MQRSSSTRGPAARPGPRGEAEKDQPPKSISGFFTLSIVIFSPCFEMGVLSMVLVRVDAVKKAFDRVVRRRLPKYGGADVVAVTIQFY